MPKTNKVKESDVSEIPKPKRFLTAYNFFFMHERAAFLSALNDSDDHGTSEQQSQPSFVAVDPAAKPWTKKTKKTHKKTHGKISFKDLTSRVSSKWKAMSPEEKKAFNDMAKEDLARFQKENKEYKEKLLLANIKKQDEAKKDREIAGPVANTTEAPTELHHEERTQTIKLSNLSKNQHCSDEHNAPVIKSMKPMDMDQQQIPSSHEELNDDELRSSIIEMSLISLPQTCSSQDITHVSHQDQLATSRDITQDPCPDNLMKENIIPNDPCIDHPDDLESISMDMSSVEVFTIGSFALMSIATENVQVDKRCSVVYEGISTRVFFHPDPPKSIEGDTKALAIKTFTDQFPNAKQVSCLENEYNILRHLSECRFTRNAISLNKKEEQQFLYLEWVMGVTLQEWIQSSHGTNRYVDKRITTPDSKFDIKNALSLAMEIAKALSDIHDFGVAHNKLTPENIIVHTDEHSGNFSVKIIDFSLASLVVTDDPGTKQVDLLFLGALYFELFSGIDPHIKKKTSDVSYATEEKESMYIPNELRRDLLCVFRSKVPATIYSLVQNLIFKSEKGYYYSSVRKVIDDLYFILTDTNTHLMDDISAGQKFLSTKIYDRDHQLTMLRDVYNRVNQHETKSEMVLVSGYSGAGKSTLVQEFRKMIAGGGGYFFSGKYDIQQRVDPISAIILAFMDLCNELATGNKENLRQIRISVKEKVGSDIALLANLIPGFDKVFEIPCTEANKAGHNDALNRVKYILRMFVQAVAIISKPLVLFLDDLQWADAISLELLTCLVTDTNNNSMLLIGSYRDNEVSANHPLVEQLRIIESKHIPLQRIRVCDFSKEVVNKIISDSLARPTHETQTLTDAVYRKTGGNVLLVIEFLRSLCDEGLIFFSLGMKQWQWVTESIEQKKIPDSAVELMSQKIITFPKPAQTVLKLVACLGHLCEELRLCLLSTVDMRDKKNESADEVEWSIIHKDLIKWLHFAVNEGVLQFTSSTYNFAHDQFQLAAYSLIPQIERARWHLKIGNWIWAGKDLAPEKALITAANQLNQGSSNIRDKGRLIDLGRLNLEAGERAMSSAAYLMAASFFESGISILDETDWGENYELCLKLHESCARAKYYMGHFDQMDQNLHQIFMRGKCFEDKQPAYFTQIDALGAQDRLEEAIKVALFVLEQLGEPFPTTPNQEVLTADIMKTEQMLKGKTDSDILALPLMIDRQKISAMKLLGFSSLYSFFFGKKKYLFLFTTRMVQLTLTYGICNESGVGFVFYGGLKTFIFPDIERGYFFGQLALRLAEMSKEIETIVRVNVINYTAINSWREHHQTGLEPLKHFYQIGMRCGEIQYAVFCVQQYCIHSFQCGQELGTVEKTMREYGDLIMEHNQELMYQRTLPFRQAALNLMGLSKDPIVLTGQAMDQEKLLSSALEKKNIHLESSIKHNCAWLAYIFGDYELASHTIENTNREFLKNPAFTTCNQIFIEGLISYAMVLKTGETKWKLWAKESTKNMQSWAEINPSNFRHKFLFLQAEFFFLEGLNDEAAKSYDLAIESAARYGFIHEQALACERAGIFHCEQGNDPQASYYYGQAHNAYLVWGAIGKAKHLCQTYPF